MILPNTGRKPFLSEEQKQEIKNYSKVMTMPEMANLLGVDYHIVQRYVKREKLTVKPAPKGGAGKVIREPQQFFSTEIHAKLMGLEVQSKRIA